MKRHDSNPILIPARSAVLLIFMPSDQTDRQQQLSIVSLADSLQNLLGDSVRVLKIDEATHPEVVRSFSITQMPAFVLIRQGIELWRQAGVPDKATVAQLSQQLASN